MKKNMKIYTKDSEEAINQLLNAMDIIQCLFYDKKELDDKGMRQCLSHIELEDSENGYEEYELKELTIDSLGKYIFDFYSELIKIPVEEYKGIDKTYILRSILNFKRYFYRQLYLQAQAGKRGQVTVKNIVLLPKFRWECFIG